MTGTIRSGPEMRQYMVAVLVKDAPREAGLVSVLAESEQMARFRVYGQGVATYGHGHTHNIEILSINPARGDNE